MTFKSRRSLIAFFAFIALAQMGVFLFIVRYPIKDTAYLFAGFATVCCVIYAWGFRHCVAQQMWIMAGYLVMLGMVTFLFGLQEWWLTVSERSAPRPLVAGVTALMFIVVLYLKIHADPERFEMYEFLFAVTLVLFVVVGIGGAWFEIFPPTDRVRILPKILLGPAPRMH